MTSYFGANGAGKPEKPAQRRDRAKLAEADRRQRLAPLTESQKTRILATAIASAAASRGAVTMEDCTLAGFSEAEAKRLYDGAFAMARGMEPALSEIAP